MAVGYSGLDSRPLRKWSKTYTTSAVTSALAINHVVIKLINPKVKEIYQKLSREFEVCHAIGVDTGTLLIARTGIRGSNDLVWVGNAANYTAKLCSLRDGDYASWTTDAVYKKMNYEVKTFEDGRSMWKARTWKNRTVYCSRRYWSAGD